MASYGTMIPQGQDDGEYDRAWRISDSSLQEHIRQRMSRHHDSHVHSCLTMLSRFVQSQRPYLWTNVLDPVPNSYERIKASLYNLASVAPILIVVYLGLKQMFEWPDII